VICPPWFLPLPVEAELSLLAVADLGGLLDCATTGFRGHAVDPVGKVGEEPRAVVNGREHLVTSRVEDSDCRMGRARMMGCDCEGELQVVVLGSCASGIAHPSTNSFCKEGDWPIRAGVAARGYSAGTAATTGKSRRKAGRQSAANALDRSNLVAKRGVAFHDDEARRSERSRCSGQFKAFCPFQR